MQAFACGLSVVVGVVSSLSNSSQCIGLTTVIAVFKFNGAPTFLAHNYLTRCCLTARLEDPDTSGVHPDSRLVWQCTPVSLPSLDSVSDIDSVIQWTELKTIMFLPPHIGNISIKFPVKWCCILNKCSCSWIQWCLGKTMQKDNYIIPWLHDSMTQS